MATNLLIRDLLDQAIESRKGIKVTYDTPQIARARYMGFVSAIRDARKETGRCSWDVLSLLRKDTTIELVRADFEVEDI